MWSIGGDLDSTDHAARIDVRLRAIEGYWNALRNGREVPPRAEVDPRGFQQALSHSFILERIAPGMARIRVSGQRINDLLHVEMRGMPISSLFTPDARAEFREVLEDVFQGPAKARLKLSGESGIFRPGLRAEMILLPLSGHRGEVSRVLGGLTYEGQIGTHPRRLVMDNSFLRQVRKKDQDGVLPRNAGHKARSRSTSVPYLRVVES